MATTLRIDYRSRYKDTAVYLSDTLGPLFGPLQPPYEFDAIQRGWLTHALSEYEIGFPDIIAVKYYGVGAEPLWWVICLVNGIIDSDLDLVPGQRIAIPPRDVVAGFVARGQRVSA